MDTHKGQSQKKELQTHNIATALATICIYTNICSQIIKSYTRKINTNFRVLVTSGGIQGIQGDEEKEKDATGLSSTLYFF